MDKIIPIHDFYEEDVRGVPIRYIPLDVRNGYDFAVAHRHNYYEIFFFTKGGGTHLIDFENHEVHDNSIHIVYPGQVHLLRRDPGSFGAVIHFSEEIAGFLHGISDLMPDAVSVVKNSPEEQQELNAVLEQLGREYRRAELNSAILRAYLHIIILRCIELSEKNNDVGKSKAPTVFIAFKKLVETEFVHHKNPGYYIDRLNVSERKLNDACKAAAGVTAGEYIKKRILLEAKRLLYNSGLSIKEISFHLGYEDPSYFNRFFKKNQGLTAGEFRLQSLQ